MRKLGARVLPAALLWLLVACRALAGPANTIDDFEGTFPDVDKWESSPPEQAPLGVKVEGGRLTLETDYALGRADLELPDTPTKTKLTFTATRVDLSSGGMFLRSVTLRVTRDTETFFGTVRAYKVNRGDVDTKVEIALGKVGATGALVWTDASTVAIDGTEDLVLLATGPNASLEFGSPPGRVSAPGLSVTAGDITLCRVEIQGNPYVQARPSIDEISASSN